MKQQLICPDCDWNGGKYGHTKQLNPDNPNDWICGACGFAWKVKKI